MLMQRSAARAVGQGVGAPQADAVDVDADPDVLTGHVAGPVAARLDQRWWRTRRSRRGPRRSGRGASAPRAQRVEDVEDVVELERGDRGLGDPAQRAPQGRATRHGRGPVRRRRSMLMSPECPAPVRKFMTSGRERPTSHLFAGTKCASTTGTHARTADHGLQLPAEAVERDARPAPRGGRATSSPRSSTRSPATPTRSRGPMGETIRNAVQLALGGFLSLASGRRGADPRTPTAPAVEGAYQLGRGEARSGRTHRRAARGVPDRRPGLLAGDVDDRGAQRRRRPTPWSTSPSWSSPTSTSCRRPRRRAHRRDRRPPAGSGSGCSSGSPRHLLDGAPADEVAAAAERAGWSRRRR